MSVYALQRGSLPLLVSLPHDGSLVPETLQARMQPAARTAPDTDWHVAQLYDFVRELGGSLLVPRYSRYVVDLNRPPDDVSLYPGQNTTGLCPVVQFSGAPVYLEGQEPDRAEIDARVEDYWRPYHQALVDEIARLRALHGRVLLWEGHSIRSEVPFLFDGRLPDFNIGTVGGSSCSNEVQAAVESVLAAQASFSWISNGRFKGGYITRHYGRPEQGVHAVQMEMAQASYMREPDGGWEASLAVGAQLQLKAMLSAALAVL